MIDITDGDDYHQANQPDPPVECYGCHDQVTDYTIANIRDGDVADKLPLCVRCQEQWTEQDGYWYPVDTGKLRIEVRRLREALRVALVGLEPFVQDYRDRIGADWSDIRDADAADRQARKLAGMEGK